jgi:hypothetical protein
MPRGDQNDGLNARDCRVGHYDAHADVGDEILPAEAGRKQQ